MIKRKGCHRNCQVGTEGQAMVEFVILLIIIMALCAGMIASVRLLTFQFWAQQEARYLAFEQTWVPFEFYADSVNEPRQALTDGARFGRPELVSERTNAREVENDGDLGELLSFAPGLRQRSDLGAEANIPLGELSGDEHPTLLAKNTQPWWKRRTSEWFGPSEPSDVSFIETAFAIQGSTKSLGGTESSPDPAPVGVQEIRTPHQERLRKGMVKLLHNQGFGPKLCDALESIAVKYQQPAAFSAIRDGDCASRVEDGFGTHLAYGVDIKDTFRTYEGFLESGMSQSEALEVTIRGEVGNQFYSFFDTAVATARSVAPVDIASDRVDAALAFANAKFGEMVSEASYVGGNLALGAIVGAATAISVANPLSRNVQAAIQSEQDIIDIMHIDADDILPVISPFFLNPTYLPIPPTFGAVAGGLQNGIMRNVLFQSEDADLRDPLIDNSNKMVQVLYQAQGGLFPLATSRIAGAEGAELSARFYLVTQPWHITRRENGTGSYRQKGTQEDTVGEETDEAMLRRRVKGLWLIPHDISALAEPIELIPGLEFLGPVFDVLGPISQGVGQILDFVTDNPFLDFVNALADLPLLGGFIPTLPQWPTVRPDAYPGSTELSGSDPSDPDKMAGDDREEFEKYIEEQRKFNPVPKPVYN